MNANQDLNSSGDTAENAAGSAIEQVTLALRKLVDGLPLDGIADNNTPEIIRQSIALARHLQRRANELQTPCLLYTSPSPRDATLSRMPSSA